jgi:lysozyme
MLAKDLNKVKALFIKIMNRLLETLKRHEGLKYHVYKDSLGYETIGVGRCIRKNVGLGLSHDEVDYLLMNDVQRCIEELDANFEWFRELNTIRKEAMINMCFNLGITRLKKFKNALAAMAEEDYNSAAFHFMDSRWATQVGLRALEVTQMIATGELNERP